jgi:basic amino acid/polyamine antiporter, APA family
VTTTYARRIGLFSATMLVIGGIIGSGIFLNPAIVAQRVGTLPLTIGAWVLGGVIALLGAFCFAELGARRPRVGGGYAYLRETFGPLPAFLYGWGLLLVIATGATAAVAVTFASYFTALVGLAPSATTPVAIAAIVLLSLVNVVGVKPGALTGNVFTLLKLAALAAVIVAGLLLVEPGGALPTRRPDAPLMAPVPFGAGQLVIAMGAALVPVLFAYGGWQQTNFVAEELIEPERNLPRALVMGTTAVVAVYVLANIAYVRALEVSGLAVSAAPAADVLGAALGPAGRTAISAGIAASTFGFLNLVILVTPRVYQAMAADGVFFPRLARLHPTFRTPVLAIVVQGVWAIVLALSGSYGQLLDYVVFGDWIFFGLTAATLFVYRRRDGAPPRAGVPLWPLTPLLFIAAAIYAVLSSVIQNVGNAAIGTGLLVAGVPVYWFWERRTRRKALIVDR